LLGVVSAATLGAGGIYAIVKKSESCYEYCDKSESATYSGEREL
jgi:hypothetical protein